MRIASEMRGIHAVRPEAIHFATGGPIGDAVRARCIRHRCPATRPCADGLPLGIAAHRPVPVVPGRRRCRAAGSPSTGQARARRRAIGAGIRATA